MPREIEHDGFITREQDLKGSKSKPAPLEPPPFPSLGEVIIRTDGVVLMCKGTFNMLYEGYKKSGMTEYLVIREDKTDVGT